MPDLDASDDPAVLVPGDAARLHEVAWSISTRADAVRETADGLTRLSTPDGWSGEAADRFRTAFTVAPARWDEAADAHRAAANAVEEHAVTVERAQRQAADAVRLWADAQAAPADAVGDPGRRGAVQLLDDARDQVRASGDRAAAAVAAARDAAPAGPGVLADLGSVAAQAGNLAASVGNAALHHPLDGLAVLGGGTLAAVSAAGAVGSLALDATGVGALLGVPLGGASALGVAAGAGLAGVGAIDLALNGATTDRVQPFGVNTDTSADEPVTPPFPPPDKITGMTKHGQERAEGRDGGVGVSDEAMADAVANPVKPPEYLPSGVYRYTGRDASVSLNEEGKVTTLWARSKNGYRNR